MKNKPIDEEAIKSLADQGLTQREIAQQLGYHYNTVNRHLKGHVYATSTLHKFEDAGGKVVLQWVKEKHGQSVEDVASAIREALGEVQPLPPISAPEATLDRLWAFYTWGDPHFGQYSWADETGDDYDLNIAQQLHYDAIDRLVSVTPAAKVGVLVSVGDTLHANDQSNVTPTSKHQLDVDTRWYKVFKTTLLTFERCVQRMLQRHEFVEVIIVPGNHDPNAIALVIALGALYRDNPRVKIHETPSLFIYRRFGKCLVGVTHGDKVKLKDLGEIMAADRPQDWGDTEFRHWFTGHIHQEKHVEGRAWTAESLRTLAGKDAYAAGHGYRSGRDMQAVIFDEEDGEVGRHRVGIKALQRAA